MTTTWHYTCPRVDVTKEEWVRMADRMVEPARGVRESAAILSNAGHPHEAAELATLCLGFEAAAASVWRRIYSV